jgi:anti-sigma factor RsiW
MKQVDMEMKDTENSTCEHAGDLVSVLYGEATERERREFELHLQQCGNCRAEFAAFGAVRESIGEWRDEALRGFVSSPAVAASPRKSALTALRQFFDLSPLWMKGAVGFAAVVFCVLVVLVLGRFSSPPREVQIARGNPAAVYTKEDVDRAVADALAKQEAVAQKQQRVIEAPKPTVVVNSAGLKSSSVAQSTRSPRAPHERRPFSRAEREQLAAELRLFSTADENDLDLDR